MPNNPMQLSFAGDLTYSSKAPHDFVRRYVLPPPSELDVFEMRLQISGGYDSDGYFANRLHILVDFIEGNLVRSVDLTDAVLNSLVREIVNQGFGSFKASLMGSVIEKVKYFRPADSEDDIQSAAEQIIDRMYRDMQDPAEDFNLGDGHKVDDYGQLHWFGFLGNPISMNPVDLKEILENLGITPNTWTSPFAIRLSSGAPDMDVYERQNIGAVPKTVGRVSFWINLLYRNVLEDEIDAIQEQINVLAEEIKQRLNQIRRELSPFGAIQRSLLGPALQSLQSSEESLRTHLQHVINQERELAALNSKAADLKRAVDQLS